MPVELAHTQSVLLLEQVDALWPKAETFQRFHDFAISTFEELKIRPTYVSISAEGKGAPQKQVKYDGRTHRRFQKQGFRGVKGFGLSATPPESDAPFWDTFARIALLYTGTSAYLIFYFYIDERFLPFASAEYERLYSQMLDYATWQYGHGYSAPSKVHPWMFLHGFSLHGVTTDAQREAIQRWRNLEREERLRKLRDLYSYNFLSRSHLEQEVEEGQTLEDFIKKQRGTEFVQLTDYGLYLWKVLDASLQEELRAYLYKRGILISAVGPPGGK